MIEDRAWAGEWSKLTLSLLLIEAWKSVCTSEAVINRSEKNPKKADKNRPRKSRRPPTSPNNINAS